MSQQPNVLIVDDQPENIAILREALAGFDCHVRTAVNGQEALEVARQEPPDLILLDVLMPDMDGYEVCRQLKSDLRTKDIPIIFVSVLAESINKVKALEFGAVDYLTKPVQMEELRVRVKTHLALRERMKELEAFNTILLEREMRVIELKKEVNVLAQQLGQGLPYPETLDDSSPGEE